MPHGVSKARPVYEGDTLLYTRRCHRREFRLTPCEAVTQCMGYLAAVLSQDHGVELSAIIVEPSHHHTIGRDNKALSPKFTQDFHSFATRALNTYFNERDSMWNCSQTSQVSLADGNDILDKIAYSMGNPVKDGLVERGADYPGLRAHWPKVLVFKRPPFWFNPEAEREDGSQRWPDEVVLTLHRPDGYEHLSDDELLVELFIRCRQFEQDARAKHKGRYIGAEALKAQPRDQSPTSDYEPLGSISPQIACKEKLRRITLLLARRLWRHQHDEARIAFKNGDRDVVFPYGTYKMRVVHDVKVAPAPT